MYSGRDEHDVVLRLLRGRRTPPAVPRPGQWADAGTGRERPCATSASFHLCSCRHCPAENLSHYDACGRTYLVWMTVAPTVIVEAKSKLSIVMAVDERTRQTRPWIHPVRRRIESGAQEGSACGGGVAAQRKKARKELHLRCPAWSPGRRTGTKGHPQ